MWQNVASVLSSMSTPSTGEASAESSPHATCASFISPLSAHTIPFHQTPHITPHMESDKSTRHLMSFENKVVLRISQEGRQHKGRTLCGRDEVRVCRNREIFKTRKFFRPRSHLPMQRSVMNKLKLHCSNSRFGCNWELLGCYL